MVFPDTDIRRNTTNAGRQTTRFDVTTSANKKMPTTTMKEGTPDDDYDDNNNINTNSTSEEGEEEEEEQRDDTDEDNDYEYSDSDEYDSDEEEDYEDYYDDDRDDVNTQHSEEEANQREYDNDQPDTTQHLLPTHVDEDIQRDTLLNVGCWNVGNGYREEPIIETIIRLELDFLAILEPIPQADEERMKWTKRGARQLRDHMLEPTITNHQITIRDQERMEYNNKKGTNDRLPRTNNHTTVRIKKRMDDTPHILLQCRSELYNNV
jgi:hypothetical protein